MSKNIQIIKATDPDNKIIIIDIQELKSFKRLENADVFKLLFGIHEESKFGNFQMDQTDDYINLFKDFNILQKDWLLFISFIKNGHIPYHLNNNKTISEIENLNNTCNKLGGIDDFDVYYRDFYNKMNTNIQDKDLYNPQCPEDDTNNEYNWVLIDNTHPFNFINFIKDHKAENGWSAHKTFTENNIVLVWWRNIKIK
tara:strand:+ start:948 stop:1541 length:594 start_codon:yes stop_codon:yes gene_type:complete